MALVRFRSSALLCLRWRLGACFFVGKETADETREAGGRRGARRWTEGSQGGVRHGITAGIQWICSGRLRAARLHLHMRWRKLTVRALCESAGRARVSLARRAVAFPA